MPLQPRDGRLDVRPAEADPDVVAGMAEPRPGQEEHALGLDEPGAEAVDVEVGTEPGEADGRALRPDPGDDAGPTLEQVVEDRQPIEDDPARPCQHPVARPQP